MNMRNRGRFALALSAMSLLAATALVQEPTQEPQEPQNPQETGGTRPMNLAPVEAEMVTNTIANWMEGPKSAVERLTEKYGQPHEATPFRMVWWNTGPWKFTMVTNEGIDHNFPVPHKDYVWQAINYNVPEAKFTELANFDGSVYARRTEGELSAKCHMEEANFLALNLAHEIVTGAKTVDQARTFYAEVIRAHMGNTLTEDQRKYVSGFTFEPPSEQKGDPDEQIGGG